MRAGLLGPVAGDDDDLLRRLVNRCTRITHIDPLAEQGALLIALAARHAGRTRSAGPNAAAFLDEACVAVTDDRFRNAIESIRASLRQGQTADGFASTMGLSAGVSGYIMHTVPVCLFCWLRYCRSFREGVEAVVRLGGDTDTTGAITGGLLGGSLGPTAIPPEWLAHLKDWPRSVRWMSLLAQRLSDLRNTSRSEGPLPLFWPGLPARNSVFLAVVLAHGVRRLLPPY
jgi:ADP-ribosyl-[dinitrogen reductase] hydrolase